MNRTLGRRIIGAVLVAVTLSVGFAFWVSLSGDGVSLWAQALVASGLTLALVAGIAFEVWLGSIVSDWLRRRR